MTHFKHFTGNIIGVCYNNVRIHPQLMYSLVYSNNITLKNNNFMEKTPKSGTPLLRFNFRFLLPFSLAQTLRDEQRYRQQKYNSPSYQKTGKIIFVVIYWKTHKTCTILI